jgi:cyclic pyranopterin phosphate synthase
VQRCRNLTHYFLGLLYANHIGVLCIFDFDLAMKDIKLSHLDESGRPQMVDVSHKPVTLRTARARAELWVPEAVAALLQDNELHTAKGPVFQTAVLAGTMAAKNTSSIIPLAHPLPLSSVHIHIYMQHNQIIIETTVSVHARTGVEMEALTAAAVAALTVYDMCKGVSHDITIREVRLLEKTGGKSHFSSAS